jgi:hypothetical protein
MLSAARCAAADDPEEEEHQDGAWRLGVRLAVTIVDVPKSFPKTPSDVVGSQPDFKLLLYFRRLLVGAPGLERGTR